VASQILTVFTPDKTPVHIELDSNATINYIRYDTARALTYLLGYLWVDSAMAPVGPLREYPCSCRLRTLSELVPLAARRLCGRHLVTPV